MSVKSHLPLVPNSESDIEVGGNLDQWQVANITSERKRVV